MLCTWPVASVPIRLAADAARSQSPADPQATAPLPAIPVPSATEHESKCPHQPSQQPLISPRDLAIRILLLCTYLLASKVHATCDPTNAQRIAIGSTAEHAVHLTQAAGTVLVEEVGVDIEYRWGTNVAFAAISAPPNRLGFELLRAASRTLRLRAVPGQGTGFLVLRQCLNRGEEDFYLGLSNFHKRYLASGASNARVGKALLAPIIALPAAPTERAWLQNSYANIRSALGDNIISHEEFLDTSKNWSTAGRSDRSAIALMAAGEEASRASRFDLAQPILEQAELELSAERVEYYRLRTAAALCTVRSRQSHYRDAITCELPVIEAMREAGELAEAVARHVSIANLRMRIGDVKGAYADLMDARSNAHLATPVVRARLSMALGDYQLAQGQLPAAAQEYARAAETLGTLGMPMEHSTIDQKLAALAEFAGARIERVRLLERALDHIRRTDAQHRKAAVLLRLARARIDILDSTPALQDLAEAKDICRQIEDISCLQAIDLANAEALMLSGKPNLARTLLEKSGTTDVVSIRDKQRLLRAQLLLHAGKPQDALRVAGSPSSLSRDPDIQAMQARIRANALSALGLHKNAVSALSATLNEQTLQASLWPSAALRLSTRNRAADLQGEIFKAIARHYAEGWDDHGLLDLVGAIEAANVYATFNGTRDNPLSEPVRKILSVAVLSTKPSKDVRDVFLALAQETRTDSTIRAGRTVSMPNDSSPVLFPLATSTEFILLAYQSQKLRLCKRLTRDHYDALSSSFEAALEGDDGELTALDNTARDWHRSVRSCLSDESNDVSWRIIATPSTPLLPWAWIAAAYPEREPKTSILFHVPTDAPIRLQSQQSAVILDLNMPSVAPLPMAATELENVRRMFAKRGLKETLVLGTQSGSHEIFSAMTSSRLLHVIGHANPAAYGQLYQGLWFESKREPMLITYPEIASSTISADLVVLSSCGTNIRGRRKFGAAALLPEAFLAAGARNVLAASNSLSDAAAPVWTRVFYQTLWESGDITNAARRARQALRTSVHFRHPKFWAGIEVYEGRSHRQ